MTDEVTSARNGQQLHYFHEDGQEYVAVWFPPEREPALGGKIRSHGSAAICLLHRTGNHGDVETVIGSADGKSWEVPGGRPEQGEDWRATLDREVLEEVCATVGKATLLGFVSVECRSGPEKGIVLIRSVWVATVSLNPWEPEHEIKHRRTVAPEMVLELVDFPEGQRPIYERWIRESLAVSENSPTQPD